MQAFPFGAYPLPQPTILPLSSWLKSRISVENNALSVLKDPTANVNRAHETLLKTRNQVRFSD